MRSPHLYNGPAFKGMTVGLLGGSFNPAHAGHLAMSLHALKQLRLDQVWWLVSPQNPLKAKKDLAKLDKRLAYARSVATHPRIRVTALESLLETRYTVDTLKALHKRYPGVHFVWLMGADNLRQLPRWKAWPALLTQVPVAIFRRPGYPAGRGMGTAAIRFDAFWHRPSYGKALIRTPTPAWMMLDNKWDYHSATEIRKGNPKWQA